MRSQPPSNASRARPTGRPAEENAFSLAQTRAPNQRGSSDGRREACAKPEDESWLNLEPPGSSERAVKYSGCSPSPIRRRRPARRHRRTMISDGTTEACPLVRVRATARTFGVQPDQVPVPGIDTVSPERAKRSSDAYCQENARPRHTLLKCMTWDAPTPLQNAVIDLPAERSRSARRKGAWFSLGSAVNGGRAGGGRGSPRTGAPMQPVHRDLRPMRDICAIMPVRSSRTGRSSRPSLLRWRSLT